MKGTVRMSNVEIKLDEIDAMCLPISPKMIFIGHVKADVPFLVRVREKTRLSVGDKEPRDHPADLRAVPPAASGRA